MTFRSFHNEWPQPKIVKLPVFTRLFSPLIPFLKLDHLDKKPYPILGPFIKYGFHFVLIYKDFFIHLLSLLLHLNKLIYSPLHLIWFLPQKDIAVQDPPVRKRSASFPFLDLIGQVPYPFPGQVPLNAPVSVGPIPHPVPY